MLQLTTLLISLLYCFTVGFNQHSLKAVAYKSISAIQIYQLPTQLINKCFVFAKIVSMWLQIMATQPKLVKI